MLAAWAVPDDILAGAPQTPHFFDPAVFTAAADAAVARTEDTPSDAAARAALPDGGTVLDVGVGAGAASLPLADRAARIVGVDINAELLHAFATRATQLGIDHTTDEGRWPDVAPTTPSADVAVCHHVIYNVGDLGPFVEALTTHARRRVVAELTAVHPLTWMNPYWEATHHLTRPTTPTADDAIAVITALGHDVQVHRWRRPLQMIGELDDDAIAAVARRLCITSDRHAELRRAMETTPPPAEREVVSAWWDVVAG